jgi:hypothetical protein
MSEPTYVTDGPWGTGTGVPHTANGADAVIWALRGLIAALEAGTPLGIDHITSDGAALTIVLTDASTQGPFTMPRPLQRPTITTAASGTTLTPVAAQANFYFRCTNAAGCGVTIDDDGTIPLDTEWHFRQCAGESTDGDGTVTFDASTDTVLNIPAGKIAATHGEGAVVVVKKVGTGSYDIFGGLADE